MSVIEFKAPSHQATSTKVVIKEATPHDMPIVNKLLIKAGQAYRKETGGLTAYGNSDDVAYSYEEGRYALAMVGNKFVGATWVRICTYRIFPFNLIEWVYVEPEFRGKDIATKLYQFSISKLGAEAIDVNFDVASRKQFYWQKLGFKFIDVTSFERHGFAFTNLFLEKAPVFLTIEKLSPFYSYENLGAVNIKRIRKKWKKGKSPIPKCHDANVEAA